MVADHPRLGIEGAVAVIGRIDWELDRSASRETLLALAQACAKYAEELQEVA
jgi:hypothetical protein